MKNFVLGLTAICGIAASANAAWGFRYEFSTDGGANWGTSKSVSVAGGNASVNFRVIAYADPGTQVNATGGPGPAVAFARLTGSEKLGNFGTAAGDVINSQTRGALGSSGSNYLLSSLGGGGTILGSTSALSFASQLLLSGTLAAYCPSSGGTPQLTWIVRTGVMTVSQLGGTRTITFGNNQRTQNTWYRDLYNSGTGQQDVNTAAPDGSATDIGATLQVVPTPGSLALVGLGGLAVARRRRA
ncbi:MAG: PEP-CTERM sorting domain-containing protein [Phycisphaerales bacterium]|nr:PEP-CTERM sorting domain-containing protein [Planctomycetota bacterium]